MTTHVRIVSVVLLGLGLLGAAGLGFWWWQDQSPRTIVLSYVQPDPVVLPALEQELREFHNLNPRLSVLLNPSGAAKADVAILGSGAAASEDWRYPFTAWSGQVVLLAAHTKRLNELAIQRPDEVGRLRSGRLDPQGFGRLLETAAGAGVSPITLGNSHGWPLLQWLQVWTAATRGPQEATKPHADPNAQAEVRAWREKGWFSADVFGLGWAQGVRPLAEGKAVFALLSAPLLTAIPAENRGDLEFLPFPHRASDPSWSLGSASFLAVANQTLVPREAEELVRFLSSPGVTQRLSQTTGRPFFSWTAQGETVVIPDWASQINDSAVRTLSDSLAR